MDICINTTITILIKVDSNIVIELTFEIVIQTF